MHISKAEYPLGTACVDKTPAQRRQAMRWAQRLKRVFNIDIESCASCGGQVRVIACIEDPVVSKKILAHEQSKEEGVAFGSSVLPRGPPQQSFFGCAPPGPSSLAMVVNRLKISAVVSFRAKRVVEVSEVGKFLMHWIINSAYTRLIPQ